MDEKIIQIHPIQADMDDKFDFFSLVIGLAL